jgi:hypothetical protein
LGFGGLRRRDDGDRADHRSSENPTQK